MSKHKHPKHKSETSENSDVGGGGGTPKGGSLVNKCNNECRKKTGAAKRKCIAKCIEKGNADASVTGDLTSDGDLMHTAYDWVNPGIGAPESVDSFNLICPRSQSAFVALANSLGQICSALHLDNLSLVLCESIGAPGKYVFAISLHAEHRTFVVKADMDDGRCIVLSKSNAGIKAGSNSWQERNLLVGTNNLISQVSSFDVIAALKGVRHLFNTSNIISVTLQPCGIGNPGITGSDYYQCQSVNMHLIDSKDAELKCTFTAGTGRTEITDPNNTPIYSGAQFSSCPCIVFSDQEPWVQTLGFSGGNSLKGIYDSILALPNPLSARLGAKPGFGWRFLYTAVNS